MSSQCERNQNVKMLSFAILFTLIGASLAGPIPEVSPRIDEGRVNRTIECIKTLCNTGKPEIGLPSYDPFILPNLNLDLSVFGYTFLGGHVSLKSMRFYNVMKFTLTNIEITNVQNSDVTKFHIVAEWPVYSFEGEYDADILLNGSTIRGKGSIREVLKKFSYEVNFQIPLPLDPENFSIKIALGGLEFHMDELIINGRDVTDAINKSADKAVERLKENGDPINKLLTDIIFKSINHAYSKKKYNREVIAEYTKCWNDSA